MSDESIRKIIEQALSDVEFRQMLVHQLEDVVSNYTLSDDEIRALKSLELTHFSVFSGNAKRHFPGKPSRNASWYRIRDNQG